VDSLGAADILAFMEKTYRISVTQKDLVLFPMNTITQMADYISQKLGE
jgi:acyl carrier protein